MCFVIVLQQELAQFGFESNIEWFSHAPKFILDALRYNCNHI